MQTIKLIACSQDTTLASGLNDSEILQLANDADPRTVSLDGIQRVELQFPKFTDGRAFSQAFLLRKRLGFGGAIRATGDVLVDQLQQMQRSGFTEAVLRADQNLAVAQAQLARYSQFYQGDALHTPAFAEEERA